MSVKFKISVTKEIIDQCKEVGVLDDIDILGNICPIAVATKHLFPEIHVSNLFIFPFGMEADRKIELPTIAKNFINVFDSLCMMPNKRLLIHSFEFEIEISDEIIEEINIDNLLNSIEVYKLLF